MANTPTARKRMRQIAKRTLRNKAVKGKMKSKIKRFEESLQSGDPEMAYASLQEAIKAIDKAAAKGIVHKNNAARKKSQLTRRFNLLQQGEAS